MVVEGQSMIEMTQPRVVTVRFPIRKAEAQFLYDLTPRFGVVLIALAILFWRTPTTSPIRSSLAWMPSSSFMPGWMAGRS